MSHWTPITPRGGGLTHATSLENAHRTMCGTIASQWRVSTEHVSCSRCRERIEAAVRGSR